MIPARGPQTKFIHFMISIIDADSIPESRLPAAGLGFLATGSPEIATYGQLVEISWQRAVLHSQPWKPGLGIRAISNPEFQAVGSCSRYFCDEQS